MYNDNSKIKKFKSKIGIHTISHRKIKKLLRTKFPPARSFNLLKMGSVGTGSGLEKVRLASKGLKL